ncbi:DUF4271 domain-containing protein [Pseudoflavitalea rhizosphaerae]|uniref:DUF4271 domain-containing protein n=1 Tax=Pseudoflavitalea rhizosphaerae TaxID=1884793 RepID=UPI000F8F7C72|nr:DUF4271 domain-containing protein [Pseudoflavitalea rhizosphaerae]
MKKSLVLLTGILLIAVLSFAQSKGDSVVPLKDTDKPARAVKVDTGRKAVTAGKKASDSLRRTAITDTTKRKQAPNVADTSRKRTVKFDSSQISKDTVPAVVVKASPQQLARISRFQDALRGHPYFNFFGRAIAMPELEKKKEDKDTLFYFIAGLLLYYALIKVFFRKYVDNIMTLFFRVTMRQQQIRDQMLQTPLASFFLNLLFLVSGGMYMVLVGRYYGVKITENDWLLLAYGAGLLLAVYLGKFILLKLAGWIFNISAATDTYIFIVFLVNKIIGILLLPVLVLMAFPYPAMFPVVLTLSYIMLALFFGYRFIISYKPIRNEIKVTRFHFFLYLCAFEIAPLLLIYKVLLVFVERSY